jgi:hypothetical protein
MDGESETVQQQSKKAKRGREFDLGLGPVMSCVLGLKKNITVQYSTVHICWSVDFL